MARKAKATKVKKPPATEPVAEPVAEAAPAEANESPRDRFLRLAPPRTESALKRIKLLSNLAGSSYEYRREEAVQIIEALFDAVHDLKRKFERKGARGKEHFTFKTRAAA